MRKFPLTRLTSPHLTSLTHTYHESIYRYGEYNRAQKLIEKVHGRSGAKNSKANTLVLMGLGKLHYLKSMRKDTQHRDEFRKDSRIELDKATERNHFPAMNHVTQGIKEFHAGNFQGAKNEFKAAIQEYPKVPAGVR